MPQQQICPWLCWFISCHFQTECYGNRGITERQFLAECDASSGGDTDKTGLIPHSLQIQVQATLANLG
jgi:hypothetical protein